MNIIKGNILTCKTGIMVHGCNAQGVMGSGVAGAIRMMYPEAYESYRNGFDWNEPSDIKMGLCNVCGIDDDLYIVNAITQEFYGSESHIQYVSYEAVDQAFSNINKWVLNLNTKFHHVNFPRIGAGLGGGDWKVLEAIINDNLDPSIERTLWDYTR